MRGFHVPALLLVLLTACGREPAAPAPGPTAADARAFLASVDAEARALYREFSAALWVANTYINEDTQLLAAKANERFLATQNRWVEQSLQFNDVELPAAERRQFELLRLNATAAPRDAARLAEMTEISARLEAAYGAGKYCSDPEREQTCRNLDELSKVLTTSRNYDELLDVWRGWRTVSPPMKQDYVRFVELMNEGARELGFADTGELWRSRYDMSPSAFEAETDRLWGQVKPLYEELHCYVRTRLSERYGHDRVPDGGLIPAHLLGNMWAQQWSNVYDLVAPYPGVADLDVTAALTRQKWDAERITRSAEDFYTSLGFPALPDSFYKKSMLTRPRDREVVCHASAWDMDLKGDVRIKQCIEPTEDELLTVYHELGHIFYFMMYNHLPFLFQNGAHDGFHEAIGDSMMMALTPAYLKQIGLAAKADANARAVINQQMKMALDKIAFLPFGKLIDQWRWDVFSGKVTPDDYNAAWWKLREHYQGVSAPVDRSKADFDPGAKYHIPANVPYVRYFLAHILQFQFYKAQCEAAGHNGPLHECSFYGSPEAGERLMAMMKLGQSEPWPAALEQLTGSRQMDAGAVIEYFAPLMAWLKERNTGQTCGWQATDQ
jgi:peptidyl-dipeptidase A